MSRLLFAFGVAALASGLSPCAFGLDVPLMYEKPSNNLDNGFPYGYAICEAAEVKPAGDWKLPAITTDKPYYVRLPLGEKNHLLILDKKKAEDTVYGRLWCDQNGDGDLTDEKPIDGVVNSEKGAFNVRFPMIDFSVVVDGVKLPYCVKPTFEGFTLMVGKKQVVRFSYSVMCCYSGVFTSANTKYTIRLGDKNGNGRFNDPVKTIDYKMMDRRSPIYVDGDVAYISDGKTVSYDDMQTMGDLLLVNDTLFEVKIDIPKNKMVLNEVKSGLLPVKLTAKPYRFSLIAEGDGHCLMAYKPMGDAIRLPPGNYRLLTYQMYRKDEQGDLWRLKAGGSNESPVVTVASGNGAVLSFGEPFHPVVTLPPVEQMPGDLKERVPLSFSIEGQGKEVMTEITHIEGASTQVQLSKNRKERPVSLPIPL